MLYCQPNPCILLPMSSRDFGDVLGFWEEKASNNHIIYSLMVVLENFR